jgi:hypothetical protein
MLLAASGMAHGQAVRGNDTVIWVAVTVSRVEYCIQADELLRKTCARAGVMLLPEKNRKPCLLPSIPFKARTARDYAEYKEFHRATLTENTAEVAKMGDDLRATFERHYGHMRSGPFSMLELEALSREAGSCETAAQRWLSPALRKK